MNEMNIPAFYTCDTFTIRVTRNSVTDTTCTDSSQTGYLFCGFWRMPFPHSSSFGYRSRVDVLVCVCECLCVRHTVSTFLLIHCYDSGYTATFSACLCCANTCITPYSCCVRRVWLHMPHARGMKILVPSNRMENTINSDEHIDDDEQI